MSTRKIKVICPSCVGIKTDEVAGEEVKCDRCDGTGQMEIEVEDMTEEREVYDAGDETIDLRAMLKGSNGMPIRQPQASRHDMVMGFLESAVRQGYRVEVPGMGLVVLGEGESMEDEDGAE